MLGRFLKSAQASRENGKACKAGPENFAQRQDKIVVCAKEDLSGPDYSRLSKRIRLKHVGVITAPGAAAINCLVIDMNETGFCLALSQPVDLPDAFSLYVPALQVKCTVEKRWASEFKIGVRIDS